MSALAVVVIGAILGGVVQAVFAARDRKREARAAALIVGDALTEALMRNHEPQRNPFRPVFIDYGAYGVVWDTERKALARTMAKDDFQAVSKAFGALRVLGRRTPLAMTSATMYSTPCTRRGWPASLDGARSTRIRCRAERRFCSRCNGA